jgi:plastocyanin
MITSRTGKARTRWAAALVLAWSVVPAGALVSAPASVVAASYEVVIEAMAFVPAKLTVKRGDTIVWVNKDLFAHTASAQDRSFDSGEMAPSAKRAFVADKRGAFPYICTLHPTMKGVLIVE